MSARIILILDRNQNTTIDDPITLAHVSLLLSFYLIMNNHTQTMRDLL